MAAEHNQNRAAGMKKRGRGYRSDGRALPPATRGTGQKTGGPTLHRSDPYTIRKEAREGVGHTQKGSGTKCQAELAGGYMSGAWHGTETGRRELPVTSVVNR